MSSEEQKLDAERKATRLSEALGFVLEDERGRHFVRFVLACSNYGEEPYDDNPFRHARSAGRQYTGRKIERAMRDHQPGLLNKLITNWATRPGSGSSIRWTRTHSSSSLCWPIAA